MSRLERRRNKIYVIICEPSHTYLIHLTPTSSNSNRAVFTALFQAFIKHPIVTSSADSLSLVPGVRGDESAMKFWVKFCAK